ncbi:MAG: uridine kinase family protein [Acutalibacteraceae bacterium]|jgi:uridine kinase
MTERPLTTYCKANPGLELQDVFKYLYQSCLGCEHFAPDYDYALECIESELETADESGLPDIEALDGNFCRVNLRMVEKGLSAETLCRLFLLSAETQEDGFENLKNKLSALRCLASEAKVPFTLEETETAIKKWLGEGLPAVHHSEAFRHRYRPQYRVVKKDYADFIPLFIRIDKAHKKGGLTFAIDGRAAAGKTSLSKLLKAVYDANIFHMDDFFLRPWQRTDERLNTPGGNVDHERFLEEVLIPISQRQPVEYRRYNCQRERMDETETIPYKSLNIIEGAYSMHPKLMEYYDFTVFMDISPELQKKRIRKRNSPELAERFFSEWIPLEEIYFKKLSVQSKADMIFVQD